MTNTIDSILKPINHYLISINRNTTNGWYELQIGLPNNWIFDENDNIECEIIAESDEGKLVRIAPKKAKILIDDLVHFVELILKINDRIAAKEREFTERMEAMKEELELEAKKYYTEIDDIKQNPNVLDELKNTADTPAPKKPRGRPKGSTKGSTTTKAVVKEPQTTKE